MKIEIDSKIDEDENEDVFELTNYERITARAFDLICRPLYLYFTA